MEPSSIWGQELRVQRAELEISRIAYVIGPEVSRPQSNIEVFMQRLRHETPPTDRLTPGRVARGADYRIDHLRVSVGEVVVQDRRGLFGSGIFGGEQRGGCRWMP